VPAPTPILSVRVRPPLVSRRSNWSWQCNELSLGEQRGLQLQSFLTSVPTRRKWSALRPGLSTSEEGTPASPVGGPQRRYGHFREQRETCQCRKSNPGSLRSSLNIQQLRHLRTYLTTVNAASEAQRHGVASTVAVPAQDC
jgi:hypothetical protein